MTNWDMSKPSIVKICSQSMCDVIVECEKLYVELDLGYDITVSQEFNLNGSLYMYSEL